MQLREGGDWSAEHRRHRGLSNPCARSLQQLKSTQSVGAWQGCGRGQLQWRQKCGGGMETLRARQLPGLRSQATGNPRAVERHADPKYRNEHT